MREIVIGTRVYNRKQDAESAIYEVRDRYVGANAMSDDDEFLRDLVALHPDAEEKIGQGIDHFEARRNGNNICFRVVRTDGTETDFSFLKCLNGSSPEVLARSAMRHAVRDQLVPIREKAIACGAPCPITGATLTRENCHADHDAPTFIEIADGFAASVGGYEKIVTVAEDGTFGRRFADAVQGERWSEFHREHANLRAVSKKANLSVLRRGVPRRAKSRLATRAYR